MSKSTLSETKSRPLDLNKLLEENPEAKFEEMADFISDTAEKGKVLPAIAFSLYIKAITQKTTTVSFQAIKDVITGFVVKCGTKINATIAFRKTPLQFAANQLLKATDEISKQNATNLAIAIIDNSAGFKLDKAQKEVLVKNILKFQPKYIKTLIAQKFYISPSEFTIDGESLADYAKKTNVGREIVEFIESNQAPVDHVARKKKSTLLRPLVLEFEQADDSANERFASEMTRGAHTQGPIKLLRFENDLYLKKPSKNLSRTIANDYGAKILRIASSKDFVVKRSALTTHNGTITFATKIDRAFAYQEDVGEFLFSQDLKSFKKFNASSAAFFGALAAVGEKDWNLDNARFSNKNELLIGIDIEPLFNGFFSTPGSRNIIFGSLQSKALLRKFAGLSESENNELFYKEINDLNDIYDKSVEKKKEQTEEKHAQIEKEACEKATELQNSGINDEMLEKIKKNIAKDSEIKNQFMAFMRGMQRVIDVARDKEFLDALDKKYKTELGEEAFLEARKCREALLQNANRANEQYGKYFEYYAQLQLEKSLAKSSEPEQPQSMTQRQNAPVCKTQKTQEEEKQKPNTTLTKSISARSLFGRIAHALRHAFRRPQIAQIADNQNDSGNNSGRI